MPTNISINAPTPPEKIKGKVRKRGKYVLRKSALRRKRFFFTFLKLTLALSLVSVVILSVQLYSTNLPQYKALNSTITNILAERYNFLQTGGFTISTGMDLESTHFLERLEELAYQRDNRPPSEPGRFFIEGNSIYLATRMKQNGKLLKKYRLLLEGAVLKSLYDITSGNPVENIAFPGIRLTYFIDSIWEIRKPVRYDKIPQDLINAVLATEDQKYLQHPGVDIPGMFRAMCANLRAGKIVQGGSTITQQTVKILTKNNRRSFSRKINEALLAMALDYRYSKEELLTVYLNNVYLGHAAPFEIRGVAAAADYILGKDLSEINLEECAILAGLIRSPNSASPLRNPKKAAKRTKTVLSQMAKQGDPLAAEIFVGKKLIRIRHKSMLHKQSWYFDALARELRHNRISVTGSKEQLIITTPLDPWMQISVTKVLDRQLTLLEQKQRRKGTNLEGATVIIDPYSGGVKALAGGKNYLKSPFNRAQSAKRQIGSLIKPFIYLAALGGTDIAGKITQSDLIADLPITIRQDGTTWRPTNYDRRYKGKMLIRSALVESRNIPAVRLGQKITVDAFLPIVKSVGIADQAKGYPSLFLGAVESSPLRMAGAYATIANGGSYTKPYFLSSVTRGDKTIYQQSEAKPLFSPSPCYVVTDMLTAVMTEGTARKSRRLGFQQIAAGKTGTTNNSHDSWFAGYTPSLVAVTWVGRDDNKSCRLAGASGALPVWIATMNAVLGNSEKQEFTVPPGINFFDIDPATGQMAGFFSRNAIRLPFVAGTRPGENAKWLQKVVGQQTTIDRIKIKAKRRKKTFPHRRPGKRPKRTWLTARMRWAADLFNVRK